MCSALHRREFFVKIVLLFLVCSGQKVKNVLPKRGAGAGRNWSTLTT